jgi:hypothetical protein
MHVRTFSLLCLLVSVSGAAHAADEIVMHASGASITGTGWSVVTDSTAAGGARLQSPDRGAAKRTAAAPSPGTYAELTFQASAGQPYRLWLRAKAQNNYWGNDSVFIQFDAAVNASGTAIYRTGTSDAAVVNLEDAANAGLSGWGWQDNGWGTGVMGPVIYFAATGTQTLRIQSREDGLGIDQVVLSAVQYLDAAPGALKNDSVILAPTGGSDPEPPPPADGTDEIVLHAAGAQRVGTAWTVTADSTAAGGARLQNANASAAKLTSAASAPASYVELTFQADAGKPYRLWLRGKALNSYWGNDSVFVQFSGSVTASGAPVYRIGTTDATVVNLEDCSGCGISGWGWQDNGWGAGVFGPLVYFNSTGTHTLRIQSREDGLAIDHVVLSAVRYLNSSPGALRNDATILPATGEDTGAPVTIVHAPYLQQVTSTSAIVVWSTRESGAARLTYGQTTPSMAVAATSALYAASRTGMGDFYQHVAMIDGLSPSTTYTYDVEVNGVDALAGTGRLKTAPAPGSGSVTFVAFGDSGTGSLAQQQIAAAMNADTFDLALHGGDLAYGSGDGLGAATHQTTTDWFFTTYRDWIGKSPMFPSLGNHDSRTANNDGRPYLDLFVLPRDAGAGAYANHAERYYSFDYGPVHFVALDTELAFQDASRRAEQVSWLEADLAASTAPWKVVYFHRSPFSAGGEHGSDLTVRSTFAPIFERYGVQLVISAHEHVYERSKPWRTGTSGGFVTYIVSGGGGGPLYTAGTAAWTAASGSFHHYLKATAGACTLTVDAVTATGSKADTVTLNRCQ